MKRFYKRNSGPSLSPDQIERQGRISRLVFETLRQPAEAITFLNTHHALLGGRPIDLAIASAEGLREVERALASLPASGPIASGGVDG